MSVPPLDRRVANQHAEHLSEFIGLLEGAEGEVRDASAETFAELVRQATQKYDLDRMAIAARFGVDKATVSRWTTGRNAPPVAARAKVVKWVREHLQNKLNAITRPLG